MKETSPHLEVLLQTGRDGNTVEYEWLSLVAADARTVPLRVCTTRRRRRRKKRRREGEQEGKMAMRNFSLV
jgi:hypothetical protein